MLDPATIMTNATTLTTTVQDKISPVLPWIFAFFALDLVIALGMAFIDKKIFHGQGGAFPAPAMPLHDELAEIQDEKQADDFASKYADELDQEAVDQYAWEDDAEGFYWNKRHPD